MRVVLLTLAVLAAHGLLLGMAPHVELPRPSSARPLVTRTIDAPVIREAVVRPPEPVRSVAAAVPVAWHPRPIAGKPLKQSAPAPAMEPQTAPEAAVPATAFIAITPAPPEPVEEVIAAASAPAPAFPRAAAAATPSAAFLIAPAALLRYKITGQAKGFTWHASGELQWRHDGASYDALLSYSIPLLPSRSQRSAGRITSEGLAPTRFADKTRSEQAAHFERDKGKVIFSSNAPDAPLVPGAQDRLSVMLQLGAMLAGQPARFPAGTTITVETVGTRDSEPWIFTVEPDELLDLPGGKVPSRKLVRTPRREFDVKVELWLGTRMDYVPVRVRLTQPNGDFVDQQWSSTDRF